MIAVGAELGHISIEKGLKGDGAAKSQSLQLNGSSGHGEKQGIAQVSMCLVDKVPVLGQEIG
jgi:hypothetical protein